MYWGNKLNENLYFDKRGEFHIITNDTNDTNVIVVSSEDSGKTFVYVFFSFDSQECPSGWVFTQGSTILFAPCIHANKW